MKIKKILVSGLLLTTVFGLASCENGDETTTAEDTGSISTVTTTSIVEPIESTTNTNPIITSKLNGDEVEYGTPMVGPATTTDPANDLVDDGVYASAQAKYSDMQTVFNTTFETSFGGYSEYQMTREEIYTHYEKMTDVDFYGFDNLTNRMLAPSTSITNEDDLIKVLDYCAFYHKSSVNLTFSNLSESEIEKMINRAYWHSTLMVSVVDLDQTVTANAATIKFYYSPFACQYNGIDNTTHGMAGIPYTFYSTCNHRSKDFDNFAYKNTTGGLLDVYNSDQLLYALQNHYLPNIIPNSPAEVVYNKAKSILNSIIYNDMTDLDKCAAIMSWVLSNAQYDSSEDYFVYIADDVFYNQIPASSRGCYAEGVLLDGLGVCHGYAKAYAILGLMEGLDLVKVSNCSQTTDYENTRYPLDADHVYSVHGYCYVKNQNDNKYYICDPVYALHYTDQIVDITFIRTIPVMLGRDLWGDVLYEDLRNDYFLVNHSQEIGQKSLDANQLFKCEVNGVSFDWSLNTTEEVNNFIQYIKSYVDKYSDDAFNDGFEFNYEGKKRHAFCVNVKVNKNIEDAFFNSFYDTGCHYYGGYFSEEVRDEYQFGLSLVFYR